MNLGVSLTKAVFIHNTRLFLVQSFFFLCIGVGIIAKFIHQKEWTKSQNLDSIRVALRVHEPSAEALNSDYSIFASKAWCTNPSSFSKNIDGTISLPFGCMPVCTKNVTPCIHPFRAYTQESESDIMLHTRVQNTINSVDTSIMQGTANDFLIPSATGFSVIFSYGFTSKGTVASSLTNIQTQIKKNGHIVSTMKPSNLIVLSVGQLFDLADASDMLRDRPSVSDKGLSWLLTNGVELMLKVLCEDVDLAEPTCSVEVNLSPLPWTFMSAADGVSVETVHRNIVRGIRVHAVAEGSIRELNLAVMLSAFISSLVLMSLPNRMIEIWAKFFLGHMSRIYRAIVKEDFDLIQEVAGMATRLMASSVLFLELQDDHGCIPRARLHERLEEVFKELEDKLDLEEVDRLSDFCFHGIVAGKESHTIFQLLKESAQTLREHSQIVKWDSTASTTAGKKITKNDFNVAYSSFERISFEDVVDLFDVQRPRAFLEMFFTPPQIKKYVFHKFEHDGDDSQKIHARRSGSNVLQTLEARRNLIHETTHVAGDLASRLQTCEDELKHHRRSVEELQQVTTRSARSSSMENSTIQDAPEEGEGPIVNERLYPRDLMIRLETLEHKMDHQCRDMEKLQDTVKRSRHQVHHGIVPESMTSREGVIDDNQHVPREVTTLLQSARREFDDQESTSQNRLQPESKKMVTPATISLHDSELIKALIRDTTDVFTRLAKVELRVNQQFSELSTLSKQFHQFVSQDESLPAATLRPAEGLTSVDGTTNSLGFFADAADTISHKLIKPSSIRPSPFQSAYPDCAPGDIDEIDEQLVKIDEQLVIPEMRSAVDPVAKDTRPCPTPDLLPMCLSRKRSLI